MGNNNRVGRIESEGMSNLSFEMRASPLFWAKKADELHYMVELGVNAFCDFGDKLREYAESDGTTAMSHRPSTMMVSLFLAALALENLLKAAFVAKDSSSVANGKFRGNILTSHDLVKIADASGVALDPDEQDLCELGTNAITHFGRYPMGKSKSQTATCIHVTEIAFCVYETLYERLYLQVLPSQAKPQGAITRRVMQRLET